ncbi:peptidoglycan-associated lipoprotein Pal [Aquabacterium sp. J223]|uniref:peptidoglycan-associated lipoprotein Pal n=1 Tax=Aquabacterium sp. J223 TaxID=2898431 RepID=UPI0021AD5E36|nr:peptidoglycan-associated lipoprotein Pal [Aquabacterium sp. J223]UUX94688.1 peptidoglycan-associated lipoprotein Pal [Aquabacterium sp. J223]
MTTSSSFAGRLCAGLSLLIVAGVLGGCASGVKLDEQAPVESRNTTAGAGAGSGAQAGAGSQSGVATVDLNRNAAANAGANLPRTVYFDFDSFSVKDEYRPVVENHAKRLQGNRQLKVTVEGHTDERGGREYNLALGQKRAESVLRAMTVLGASESQLEAVSYGKERPAVQGSDESAYAQNRRAEIKDR